MSWHKEAHEIDLRRDLSKQQGGEEAIAIHHAKGRLTIRERIDALTDQFEEHGEGAGFAEKGPDGSIQSFSPANYVVGFGDLGGRRVVVGSSQGENLRLGDGGQRETVRCDEFPRKYGLPAAQRAWRWPPFRPMARWAQLQHSSPVCLMPRSQQGKHLARVSVSRKNSQPSDS